eukprot:scaffold1927_cov333-Pavlova_lutheri.AAC.21
MFSHQDDETFPQRIRCGRSGHRSVSRLAHRIRPRQGSEQFSRVFHAVIVGKSQRGSIDEAILLQQDAQGRFATSFVQEGQEPFLHDGTRIPEQVSSSSFPRRFGRSACFFPPPPCLGVGLSIRSFAVHSFLALCGCMDVFYRNCFDFLVPGSVLRPFMRLPFPRIPPGDAMDLASTLRSPRHRQLRTGGMGAFTSFDSPPPPLGSLPWRSMDVGSCPCIPVSPPEASMCRSFPVRRRHVHARSTDASAPCLVGPPSTTATARKE